MAQAEAKPAAEQSTEAVDAIKDGNAEKLAEEAKPTAEKSTETVDAIKDDFKDLTS